MTDTPADTISIHTQRTLSTWQQRLTEAEVQPGLAQWLWLGQQSGNRRIQAIIAQLQHQQPRLAADTGIQPQTEQQRTGVV